MHLTCTRDLQPAVAEAHIDLGRGLGEREERWTESQLKIIALEKAAHEVGEDSLELGKADCFIDPQTFDLMEHGGVRCVAVDAIDPPRCNDLDRWRMRFHVAHLDR